MSDLNLLPSQAKFQAERMHLKMVINNFLWVFGGLWVLLLVGIFLFKFVLNLNLSSLDKNYKKVLGQYESLMENMSLNQKIKYQAKIVAKVLSDRFEYGNSMELVSGLFSEGIIIENLEVVESKKFQIEGRAVSGENMDEVEDRVTEINSGLVDGVVLAEIKDVVVDSVKGWRFVVEVKLK